MVNIETRGYYIQATYNEGGQQIGFMWGYVGDGFIHLMRGDVIGQHQRNGIMTEMIKRVQVEYPDRELSFHQLTREGKAFVLTSFPGAKVRAKKSGKFKKMTIVEYIESIKTPNKDTRSAS